MSGIETKMNPRATAVVNDTFGLALERDDAFVTPEHVLHVLINPDEMTNVTSCLGMIEVVNPGAFEYQWGVWERDGVIEPCLRDDNATFELSPKEHPRLARVFELAEQETLYRTFTPDGMIGVEQLLVAIVLEGGAASRFLNSHGLYYDGLRASLYGNRDLRVAVPETALF